MPVRNAADFLPAAILSIARQSRPVDEILIVDDGSTDGTTETVAELAKNVAKIKVIPGPGRTPSVARNAALEHVTGEVIAFLDADDLWPDDKLQRQMDRLRIEPAVDAVWGKVRWFDRQHADEPRPAENAKIVDVFGVNLGAGLIRRTVIERVGPLDDSLTYAEDVDFVLRIRDFGVPITVLPCITLYYRRHSFAMTAKLTPLETSDYQKVVMRSAMRRIKSGKTTRSGPKGVLADLVEVDR